MDLLIKIYGNKFTPASLQKIHCISRTPIKQTLASNLFTHPNNIYRKKFFSLKAFHTAIITNGHLFHFKTQDYMAKIQTNGLLPNNSENFRINN